MKGIFSRKFHKQTDFDFPIGKLPGNPQYWPKEWTEIYHKEYPRFDQIPLSENILPLGDFSKTLSDRHSTREFDLDKNLSFEELSTLLFYSAGIKPEKYSQGKIRRFYPSGGARYPLEIYLLVQRVSGLTPGIYHFNVKLNCLEELTTDLEDIENTQDSLYYPWSRDVAAAIFVTAVWDRNFMKYEDRGYRIVLMEAGHLAQNVALTASALSIGCCNSVGFHNHKVNEILDIENEDEDSLSLILLGK
jgi:SagB-type dehydrogenase family enzyme